MPRETRSNQVGIGAGGNKQFERHLRLFAWQVLKAELPECEAEPLGVAQDTDRAVEGVGEHRRELEYVHLYPRRFVQHAILHLAQSIPQETMFHSFLLVFDLYIQKNLLLKRGIKAMSSAKTRRQVRGELDVIDRKILSALRENARLTNNELAERVGLSPSPCWNRVKRLEANGTIERYTAVIDQSALGLDDIVFIEVTLQQHDEHVLQQFGNELSRIPEVLECHLVTGEYDYLVKVAVSGTADYERFLRERLYRINGIRHSRTTFSLRALKRTVCVDPLAVG